jgi:CheY-like chemotaxis protein
VKKNILAIDDTPTNLDFLLEFLEEYEVIDTVDGFDGLEIVKEEKIDLVLLDIVMPEIDGFEVCRRLKADPETKDIPVIFLTSKTDSESIKTAFEVGAVDYVTKPFKKEELLSRVHTHLKISDQKSQLENLLHNIKSSIAYASIIQEAIIPEKEILDRYFRESFVFWKPRDLVGGDIYFINELNSGDEVLIMVIDGAGHGVSGAFVTMLVKAIESQIIAKINNGNLEPSPAKILERFNVNLKTMLKQDKGSKSSAGFDGGILYFNKKTRVCKFAGAKSNLLIKKGSDFEVIKSDRKNVGFPRTKITQTYTDHEIEISHDLQLYIATDGFTDQEFGNSTYGIKNFRNLLLENSNLSAEQQSKNLESEFEKIRGKKEQTDDITVLGICF